MHDILAKKFKLTATFFFLVQSGVAIAAEEKLISGALGASQLWDSNFFRDPEGEELSEQITLLTAGVGLATNISRQQLSIRWRVRSYQHAENKQFDETFQDGVARWNGAWAGDFTSNLELSRDSYLIDRWELDSNVEESDVVSRDIGKFVLTKGRDNRFSFQVGASKAKQQHSNSQFDNLNFEEEEGFVGITYKTPSSSTLTLRYRASERTFDDLSWKTDNDIRDYNFESQQVEVENIWKISEKTSSTVTFARFRRDGDINDSTGDFATLDFSWDVTPKIQWRAGYTYKEPAIGETLDTPTTIETAFLIFSWDITPKLSLSSRAEKVWRDYSNPINGFPDLNATPDDLDILLGAPRKESQLNIAPIALTYIMNESLSFKLDTSWRKSDSPRPDRTYELSQGTIGVVFRF
jgi:hypothetical protein